MDWRLLTSAPVLLLTLSAPTSMPPEIASDRVPALRSGAREVPRAAPPIIGFLDFHLAGRRPADLDSARAINARIPFADAAVRLARPFFLSGAATDQARAIDCLAAAGYYEAGDDTGGQRAVMQVVLNRLRNPAYPQSVCGVVFQGAERRTGCQFTFTCDGAMIRYRPTPLAWARARQTAVAALNGYTDARVGQATHYHTDWVHPYWSATLDKVAAVGTHLFFLANARAPAGAFAAYSNGEPTIARMAALSLAHLSSLPPASAAAPAIAPAVDTNVVAALPALAAAVELLPDRVQAPREGIFLVTLDAGASPESFRRQAEASCAGLNRCKFIGWTDASRRVDQFPLPGRAIDAIAFSFTRTEAAPAIARWDCRQFPRAQTGECLRRSTADSSPTGTDNTQ